MRYRIRTTAAALCLLMAIAAGCGANRATQTTTPSGPAGTATPAAPAPGAEYEPDATLIVGHEIDATTFDMPSFSGAATVRIAPQVYDRLVKPNLDGSYSPALATEWNWSSDFKTYTFKLRPNVKFHDGTAFNATAVVKSYERVLDPAWSTAAKQWAEVIGSIKALDDLTVQFNLKVPHVAFMDEYVASDRGHIMSPTAFEKGGKDYGKAPVGTGAFKFVEWKRDDKLVFTRNDDYWGGAPKIKTLIYRPIPDAETRMLELEQGKIHIATQVPLTQVAALQNHKEIRLLLDLTLSYRGYYFNIYRPPFDQLAVRQAITHAIDAAKIVSQLGGPLTVRSQGPVYLLNWALDKSIKEPEFDPELSRKILTDAGWTKGSDGIWQKDGKKLSIKVTTPVGRWPNDSEMTQSAVQYLRQFGIDATARPLEWAAFLDTVRTKKDFDLAMWGVGRQQTDPTATGLTYNFACGAPTNPAGYCDKAYDELLKQAVSTADIATRKEWYSKAQRFIMDNYWVIGLYNENETAAVRNSVEGYSINIALQQFDFTKVMIRKK